MEYTQLIIRRNQEVIFEDLTIGNVNGGHDIEMDGHDEPFAEMIFKTPRTEVLKRNLYRPLKGPDDLDALETFTYDAYTIRVKNVLWDGEEVTLLVGKS